MTVVRRIDELRAALSARRSTGPVGFVPTMGALHAGHAALCAAARKECRTVVASIFVNPAQFEDPTDLARYPRPEENDTRLAAGAGVDILFLPRVTEIYPDGFALKVDVGGAATGFEGASRPGHFAGVATVCLKLFAIVAPTFVYLGQKDAQQVAVLRQLVRDANLDLTIRAVPTVRELDGVAMSSRNARLTPAGRAAAQAVPRALAAGLAAHSRGADPVAATRRALDGLEIEYVGVAPFDGHPTLVVAVRVGGTRLIDNVPLDDPALAGLDARQVTLEPASHLHD